MTGPTWADVDRYITECLVPSDPALDAALEASAAAGLPAIQVSPTQGRFLHLLAVVRGARRILEIGTLGGYSTIWLARALPAGGRMITLESEPRHVAVARASIANAGLAGIVEVREGRALETLAQLRSEGTEPFDLFFIDADKVSNADYFLAAVGLSRPGSVIVVDNVVRNGAILEAGSTDADIQGTRRLYDTMGGDRRVAATALQTVGTKEWDGFALAVVTAAPEG